MSVIENAVVTTIPNLFEVAKQDNVIIFGDWEDMKAARRCLDEHPLQREFFLGNYSASKLLNYGGTGKSAVVFHQENVDPHLVTKELMEWEKRIARGRRSVRNRFEKNVFGPSDWLTGRRLSLTTTTTAETTPTCCSSTKRTEDAKRRDRKRKHSSAQRSQPVRVGHNTTTIEGRDSAEDAETTASFNQCFYLIDGAASRFINNRAAGFNMVYSTDGIYTLKENGTQVGFAVPVADVFPSGGISGVLYCDRNGGCFAIVLHQFFMGDDESARLRRRRNFEFPIEAFLYGTADRSFYKNGVAIDNSYYGAGVTPDFDFRRLPDNIFLKVQQYLPWRQRVLCRRVDRRWLAISNLAISMDTPILNLDGAKFKHMRSRDLKWLLPIVFRELEVVKLRRDEILNFLDVDFLSSIPSFPKLRKIDFSDANLTNHESFVMLLAKSANLRTINMALPKYSPQSSSYSVVSFDQVEKFTVNYPIYDDQRLLWVTHFPQLTTLRLMLSDAVTISALSVVIQKHAHALTRLALDMPAMPVIGRPVVGCLTAVAECHQLEYLTLRDLDYVSDAVLVAVVNGCPKLTTLDVVLCSRVTGKGVESLVSLPNLKRLRIMSTTENFSSGLVKLAQYGHLEQVITNCLCSTVCCLKAFVRHCPQLTLLSVSGRGRWHMAAIDAKEIIALYGKWGRSNRLTVIHPSGIWTQAEVVQSIEAVRVRDRRSFVIKGRGGDYFLDEERSEDDEEDSYDDDDDDADEDALTISDVDYDSDSDNSAHIFYDPGVSEDDFDDA